MRAARLTWFLALILCACNAAKVASPNPFDEPEIPYDPEKSQVSFLHFYVTSAIGIVVGMAAVWLIQSWLILIAAVTVGLIPAIFMTFIEPISFPVTVTIYVVLFCLCAIVVYRAFDHIQDDLMEDRKK